MLETLKWVFETPGHYFGFVFLILCFGFAVGQARRRN